MRTRILPPLTLVSASLLLMASLSTAGAPKEPARAPIMTEAQDFMFLAEARPVLVRMHVRIDGKPLQVAYDEFMSHLFAYLDVDGDGTLNKAEAERAPSASQLQNGGVGQAIIGGFPGRGRQAPTPTMDALDADKDGKVTLAELSAYYRKNGFAPFQFQMGQTQNPLNAVMSILGGPGPEPSVTAVADSIFALLDTDKDGKLSREELAQAPTVLLRRDEDEDEIVTPRELVTPSETPANPLAGLMAMGGALAGNQDASAGNKFFVPVPVPGEVPATLVRNLQERYGKADKPEEAKLTRKDLGLDEKSFAQLDVNKDGVLDADELAGLVKRPPDLELVIRLGKRDKGEARIEVLAGRSPLAGSLHIRETFAQLDLGVTRADLATSEDNRPDRLGELLREQYLLQFNQADPDGKGFIEEGSIKNNRLLRGQFKAMDRDGDGKVTRAEFLAYFDHLQELQKRATAASVTLDVSDQSRGLFDLLDTDRDGRLSVREMRGAVRLLETFDRGHKGCLTKEDVPKTYRLLVRRGPATSDILGGANAFFDLYGGAADGETSDAPGRGPLWFRKMDTNRDGDVSRKEFLFGEELFKQIDTDGDGLISVEEAERFDQARRKREK